MYILNTATGAVDGKIEGFGMPYRIGIARDGKTAVVSDAVNERIGIVDVPTRIIRATIEPGAGSSPQGVSLSPDGKFAFVTLKALGQVAIVELASGKIAGRITVGGGSDGVGFSPAR